jgi:hypothetical protein
LLKITKNMTFGKPETPQLTTVKSVLDDATTFGDFLLSACVTEQIFCVFLINFQDFVCCGCKKKLFQLDIFVNVRVLSGVYNVTIPNELSLYLLEKTDVV